MFDVLENLDELVNIFNTLKTFGMNLKKFAMMCV